MSIKKIDFECPILFLVSKDDKFVPWENTISLWQTVPFSELRIFKDLGHDITTDNPSLIANTLADFLLRAENKFNMV